MNRRRITTTETAARLCAVTAGNQSMIAAGRTAWNLTDFRVALEEYADQSLFALVPAVPVLPPHLSARNRNRRRAA